MRSTIQQVCALIAGAVVLGWVLNTLRPNPIPWRYVKPITPAALIGTAELGVPGLIELEELRKATPAEVLIIDARPPLFYRRSHIPGAINLAKEYLARDFSVAEPRLRNAGARRLVVYCAHEECEDAQTVAHELSRMGFERVAVFKGGWKAWKEAGLPEENG